MAADNVSFVGFAYTQFALPVRVAPGGRFDFRPAANLSSPAAVMPLVLMSDDGRVELLAPLGAWHEQVIAVDQDDAIAGFRWGWHGDLADVPAGFRAELGIFTGTSIREVFDRWGGTIRTAAGTQRPGSDVDPLLTHLSYWTDNGAAYWYRTEPGADLTSTLQGKVAELDELGVSVRSVELDSWFYPHEISRPVAEVGYLEEVPPTGMLSWTPRADVLPGGSAACEPSSATGRSCCTAATSRPHRPISNKVNGGSIAPLTLSTRPSSGAGSTMRPPGVRPASSKTG
ncbi:MAG: hypothetical protein R2710_06890 [Acidimicrobiales bacterium]